MTTQTLRRLRGLDVETILDDLTRRQFIAPHKPLGDVLTEVATVFGLTLACVRSSAERASLDACSAVGRLRREEVARLAGAIHRAHRHVSMREPQPVNTDLLKAR